MITNLSLVAKKQDNQTHYYVYFTEDGLERSLKCDLAEGLMNFLSRAAVVQPDPHVTDSEGWILHDGTKMPVPRGTKIMPKFRDGTIHHMYESCQFFDWVWESPIASHDLVSYKIKP